MERYLGAAFLVVENWGRGPRAEGLKSTDIEPSEASAMSLTRHSEFITKSIFDVRVTAMSAQYGDIHHFTMDEIKGFRSWTEDWEEKNMKWQR